MEIGFFQCVSCFVECGVGCDDVVDDQCFCVVFGLVGLYCFVYVFFLCCGFQLFLFGGFCCVCEYLLWFDVGLMEQEFGDVVVVLVEGCVCCWYWYDLCYWCYCGQQDFVECGVEGLCEECVVFVFELLDVVCCDVFEWQCGVESYFVWCCIGLGICCDCVLVLFVQQGIWFVVFGV